MTHDKAREYFSAYHEGTLEPGLRASLERKIAGDSALRSEYEAFSATVGVLDALRFETIESPSYLSDRIASRLESARETASVPFWASWFGQRPASSQASPRFVWAVGLAACALLASIGLKGMQSADTFRATFYDGTGTDSVRWVKSDDGVTATFAGGDARQLSVIPQGGQAENYRLADRQPLEVTFSNPNVTTHRFTVTSGKDVVATIVLPGRRPGSKKPGSGTVDDFAAALADSYRVPVVIKGTPAGGTLKWTFESMEPRTAAEQGLDGQGSATMMDGNVLQIVR